MDMQETKSAIDMIQFTYSKKFAYGCFAYSLPSFVESKYHVTGPTISNKIVFVK